MTYDDLDDKHFDVWSDDTDVSNSQGHSKISVEYAIYVLEDIQMWWEMGSENRERLDAKISELKSLIQ